MRANLIEVTLRQSWQTQVRIPNIRRSSEAVDCGTKRIDICKVKVIGLTWSQANICNSSVDAQIDLTSQF